MLLTWILAFVRKQWKAFAIAGVILSVGASIYLKGRRDCANQMEREVARELERRTNAVQQERERTDRITDSIRHDREVQPEDDERDSCLLSNDPYKVNCLKGGK